MMKWFFILSIILTLVCDGYSQWKILKIQDGFIRGTTIKSLRGNQKFLAFLGIPYAEPPVGSLRFKGPQLVKPWIGILDATKEGCVCPQIRNGVYKGQEDCLFLNVFTNQIKPTHLMNVMVWFHHGVFLWRSGNRENAAPDFFVQQDIIFVSVNYRLGPLGFLSLQTEKIPGNAGLKDQVLALQWVQKNIQMFGGDPSKVTIVGQSAGSISVHFHLLSPLSRGLFHKAILESGTSLRPWYFKYPSCNTQYIEEMGLNISDPDSTYQYLMTLTPFQLLQPVPDPMMDPTLRITFCPTMDLKSPSGEVFLPDTPSNLLRKGRFQKIPILIGSNNEEAINVVNALRTVLNTNAQEYFQTMIPSDLNAEENITKAKEIAEKIKKFYFSSATENKLLVYIKYVTDVSFFIPTYCTLKIQSEHSKQPQFTYEFSVDGSKHLFSQERQGLPGASHKDELAYLYASDRQKDFDLGSLEYHISVKMVKLWTNFVKQGNPTLMQESLFENITWIPFSLMDYPYLDINVNLTLRHYLRNNTVQFWKNLYQSYNPGLPCWT